MIDTSLLELLPPQPASLYGRNRLHFKAGKNFNKKKKKGLGLTIPYTRMQKKKRKLTTYQVFSYVHTFLQGLRSTGQTSSPQGPFAQPTTPYLTG